MPYTAIELEKVRSELPKRSAQKIAQRTGFAVGTVRNVLSGFSNNDAIIVSAIEIIAESKQLVESTKKTIAAL